MFFFKSFNINEFSIKEIDANTFYFSHIDKYITNDITDDRTISGIICKDYVVLKAKKCLKSDSISFTTLKTGNFKIIGNSVIYSEKYSTIKSICNSSMDIKESMERNQMYEFSDFDMDFLSNYQNLVSKKWPIISDTTHSKKIVKKC